MEKKFQTVKNSFRISAEVCLSYEIRSKHFNSSKETIKLIMIMGAFGTMKHLEEQPEYIVNYFIEKAQSIEVLTYDHRGIGQSISTSNERQTSSILANDAYSLINHVWNDDSVVDVYGASMGGMVAQELSSLLRESCRIRSLYLSVTSRGDFIRPMCFGPSLWKKLMPMLIKKDPEQMVRQVLIPASFSSLTIRSQGEAYAKLWIDEYDQWWAFNNRASCANQCSVSATHYLTDDKIRLLVKGNIPITVQIAKQDRLIPPKKQIELAKLLHANIVTFDHGHLGDDHIKIAIFQSIINHLENPFKSNTI